MASRSNDRCLTLIKRSRAKPTSCAATRQRWFVSTTAASAAVRLIDENAIWSASSVSRGLFQSMRLGELIGLRHLIEAPDHHDPIDHPTLGGEADPAIWGADHRSHPEIQLRRGALVQFKLGLAGCPTPLCVREVEVGKLDCAFELVGRVGARKNQRHMGFDDVDALDSAP